MVKDIGISPLYFPEIPINLNVIGIDTQFKPHKNILPKIALLKNKGMKSKRRGQNSIYNNKSHPNLTPSPTEENQEN